VVLTSTLDAVFLGMFFKKDSGLIAIRYL
jgi:hypothetical protein